MGGGTGAVAAGSALARAASRWSTSISRKTWQPPVGSPSVFMSSRASGGAVVSSSSRAASALCSRAATSLCCSRRNLLSAEPYSSTVMSPASLAAFSVARDCDAYSSTVIWPASLAALSAPRDLDAPCGDAPCGVEACAFSKPAAFRLSAGGSGARLADEREGSRPVDLEMAVADLDALIVPRPCRSTMRASKSSCHDLDILKPPSRRSMAGKMTFAASSCACSWRRTLGGNEDSSLESCCSLNECSRA